MLASSTYALPGIVQGERAIYTFNGPLDNNLVDGWAAVVTCTNYGTQPTDIFVIFFNETGDASPRVSASAVAEGTSVALATRNIPVVTETDEADGFVAGLGSGVVGVSVPGAARSVACNGSLVEMSNPAKFITPIPMLRVGAPTKLK